VIIIFLNAERFLQEAIDSVLAQTYQDWEILLIDDGSADGSTAVAKSVAEEHPGRIHYLEHSEHQNRGMSASRNLGLNHARGEYIAFLDADDVWFPTALEDQAALLEANPEAAFVYGPIQYWHSWTGDPADMERDQIEDLGVPPDSLVRPPELLQLFLRDRAAVPSGIMVRREAIERYGGFEEAFMGEYEDQVFCAKICLNAPVFAASRCWYRYRQHPDSSVSAGLQTGASWLARRTFLDWLYNYLSSQGVRHRKVRWALELESWRYKRPGLFHLLRSNRHRLPRALRL
jgi:glycosyltransferase involved in cell wall biosynthesis